MRGMFENLLLKILYTFFCIWKVKVTLKDSIGESCKSNAVPARRKGDGFPASVWHKNTYIYNFDT